MQHVIVSREEVVKTPYFSLVAKTLAGQTDKTPHYAIQTHDYVSIIATTPRNEILLVRQYRPAVECVCLELPSGHVDPGESPEQAARRELLEETGYQAGELRSAGRAKPDVGRLSNGLWVFVGAGATPHPAAPPAEAGLERVAVPFAEFRARVKSGEFDHGLHLAALAMARVQGLIPGVLFD